MKQNYIKKENISTLKPLEKLNPSSDADSLEQ